MGGIFVSAVPMAVVAAPADDACAALKLADPSAKCGSDAASQKEAEGAVGNIVKTIINTLSILVGAVSVIMIIIGGFRYVVSNGDSNAVTGAKNAILYAVVGLVIVIFAQVIVRFVLSNATAKPATTPPAKTTTKTR